MEAVLSENSPENLGPKKILCGNLVPFAAVSRSAKERTQVQATVDVLP